MKVKELKNEKNAEELTDEVLSGVTGGAVSPDGSAGSSGTSSKDDSDGYQISERMRV